MIGPVRIQSRRVSSHLVGMLVVASMSVASVDAEVPTAVRQARGPARLSGFDWSGIRAAYEAGRHAVEAVEGGYLARNPGQAWHTRFDGRGFVTAPDGGDWSWGLELAGHGRRGAERAVSGRAAASSRCGQCVEYEWEESLTEWYVNDGRGLEHGYTVRQRPARDGKPAHVRRESFALRAWQEQQRVPKAEAFGSLRSPVGRDEPLCIMLAVRGDLLPCVSEDGRAVRFVNGSGAAVVNYSGLTVVDADGVAVPAWFEMGSSQQTGLSQQPDTSPLGVRELQFISIVVDDTDAVYPLTIDPIAQQAYLKASNTGAGDLLGSSLAVSGDTVVVGAPGESSSATGINGNQADDSAGGSGAAYVFVRDADGIWSQQAYLKASNSEAGDSFGLSVAVSGDTVVVGAPTEDSNAGGVNGNQADNSAAGAGAAYVFVRDAAGAWSQQAYLKASNTAAGDRFGQSVAVSGDSLVVGANDEDSSATGVNGNQGDDNAADSGAAYVFVRGGTTWSQQAYLKASNTGASDFFGDPVAVYGDTVVVGVNREDSDATGVDGNQADNSASDSGAAYVFVRSGTTWSQQAYLKASNTEADDFFGQSVAVSGDTVVVGGSGEDSDTTGVDGDQADNSATLAGAAYVFIRSGTTWSQQAYLKASNAEANDDFGWSVAVSGDTVVVGAILESSDATGVDGDQSNNNTGNSGAAYVFVRSGTTWSQLAYLKASNTGAGDGFGDFVAVSGDTVVVAATNEHSNAGGVNGDQDDNSASSSGAAYIFVVDTDGDGVRDSLDGCASDPDKTEPGDCGCGVADDDGDADGVADCVDNCPSTANADQADADMDGVGDLCEPPESACCGGGLPAALPLAMIAWARLRRRRPRR